MTYLRSVPITAAPSTTVTPPIDSTIGGNALNSPSKSTAVLAGSGIPLGLALLGALGLLWRQRLRELGARIEARAWEETYDELRREKRGDLIGIEGPRTGWRADELDGRLVYEMAGKVR